MAFNRSRGSRPATKHGVGTLLATGEMPRVPGADEVEREVEALIAGIVSDLGGPDEITSAHKAVLAGLRVSLQVQGLAELHVRRVGVANAKTGKPTALLSVLATFINSARLSCAMLGLERRPRKMGPADLSEYVPEYLVEPNAETKSDATSATAATAPSEDETSS